MADYAGKNIYVWKRIMEMNLSNKRKGKTIKKVYGDIEKDDLKMVGSIEEDAMDRERRKESSAVTTTEREEAKEK